MHGVCSLPFHDLRLSCPFVRCQQRGWLLIGARKNATSSGCVGGCVKPPPVTASDKPSKRQRPSKRGVRSHAHPPKDWWTSSSNEMENNSANSRGSRRLPSSAAGVNHSQDSRGSNNANSSVFVNHALALWNERRREWVGTRPRQRPQQPREPVISWSTTYEDLLATSRPFPQPVPLPEMVDFLVDVWQQEGLYE